MTERVLVVDDTFVTRKLLTSILSKDGYELVEAGDGKEALDMVSKCKPDIVLLDVMMPGIDGYDTCKHLKESEESRDIPVIFLSGKSSARNKIKGLELGAVDYITKPFDKGEVLARVRSQLQIQSLTRSLRDANQSLREKQKQIDKDLIAAADIQKSLIPSKSPNLKGIEMAWRFFPCDEVGGDIFNIIRLDESRWAFYQLDVSGHGVPAAMVTVSVSQMLSSGGILKRGLPEPPYYEIVNPSEVLEKLDDEYPIDRFDKFFTIGYVVFDIKTGKLEYSSAAHPLPALVRADGTMELLEAGGTIIGLGRRLPFELGETQLQPGDRLYFYTDGIVEFANPRDECFGEERFWDVLVSSRDRSLEESCDAVIDSVMKFGDGASPQDDITLVGFEFNLEASEG